MVFQCSCELFKVFGAGDLRIEAAVVGDVIAVAAAGAGFEQRRQIAMTYSQLIQIGNQPRSLLQIEVAIQLQPVSRPGNPQLQVLRDRVLSMTRHLGYRPLLTQREHDPLQVAVFRPLFQIERHLEPP